MLICIFKDCEGNYSVAFFLFKDIIQDEKRQKDK